MNEPITFPVEHLGVTYEFPLTIVQRGYTYQLHIGVNDQVLIFERDDSGEYRVTSGASDKRLIDKSLIGSIIAALEELQKSDS
jgi:hypothetical protein